jgi:hypothetical protein
VLIELPGSSEIFESLYWTMSDNQTWLTPATLAIGIPELPSLFVNVPPALDRYNSPPCSNIALGEIRG